MRSSSWFGGAMHIECSNWLGVVQRRCSNWFRDMYHRGSDWLGAMHVRCSSWFGAMHMRGSSWSCASCTMFMKECNGLESILMTYYLRLTMDLDITFGFWATLMMLCNLGQFLCPIKWIWKYAFEATQWIWRYAFEATQWIWSYAYEATQLIWSNSYENAMGLDVLMKQRNGFLKLCLWSKQWI